MLDTNVFVSGIVFTGPPHRILRAWREGQVTLVISPEIYGEQKSVGLRLAADFGVELRPFLWLLLQSGEMVLAPPLSGVPCPDGADVKFLACGLAGGVGLIVSGDRHLLQMSGYRGLAVLTPRRFVDAYLSAPDTP